MTDEARLIPRWYYKDAVFAVDPGACNLSGLARELGMFLDGIESELQERDPVVRLAIRNLNTQVDEAWDVCDHQGTKFVNTYPGVKRYVKELLDFAYEVEHMRRVAAHPVVRLIVDQMRQLSGTPMPGNPNYTTLWTEAFDICEEKGMVKEARTVEKVD